MKNHDSDDDFLNELYKQTADERPPTELDKNILILAKAKHQQNRFAKTMNLQRILSVAAVMVLSVYIFFEVDQNHPEKISQELFHSPQKASKSASLDAINNSAEIKQNKMKHAKKLSERESPELMASDISELASQEANTSSLSARPSMTRVEEELQRKLADHSPNSEDLFKEIEALLASGKLGEAKLAYQTFKVLFPKYNVPKAVSEILDPNIKLEAEPKL